MSDIPRVYIAGKITGLEESVYMAKFNEMENFLKENMNCHVYNPSRKGKKLTLFYKIFKRRKPTWKEYMIYAVKHLVKCDTILMLNNWSDSDGAKVEHDIAKGLRMTMLYERNSVNNIGSADEKIEQEKKK